MSSPSLPHLEAEATTLMSTDADNLDSIAEMLHETWAQLIEVVIGIVLLAKQVGWIWPLPLVLIFLCSHMSRFVSRNLQPRQKAWNEATQRRIAATSSMLSSMKMVKMLGFQSDITHRIEILRDEELSKASKLRWVMVYYNSSANALGLFSPAITLVLFALLSTLRGQRLDTTTAFTTIAILGLALARALLADCDVIVLDDIFSALDGETESSIYKTLFGAGGALEQRKATVILVSNSTQFFSTADHVVVLGDGGVIDQGPWKDIKMKAASVAKFSAGSTTKDKALVSANSNRLNTQLRIKDEAEMDLTRQTGDSALYGYYLSFINRLDFSFLTTETSLCAFFMTAPQYWLKLWTEAGDGDAFYMTGFLTISFLSWALTSAQMWSVLIRIAPQSGSRLHHRLLQIISNAPLSYFSSTDNGFSQDMQLVDKQLPSAMQTVITQVFKLLMQTILLCMSEIWLATSLPICVLLVYIIQKFYLRTSRQLRFLELESRAHVFSSFLESIEGLETIRSFQWPTAFIQNNIRCIDNSQRPEFLLMCLQRWLNLVLDLLVAGLAIAVVALAVVFRADISGAQVGIALNMMLVANKTLLKLMESWTTLETSLGAIARIQILEKMTPVEGRISVSVQPAIWPSKGRLELRSISACYRVGAAALRGVDLVVCAGQKLVVCGRTGSGKSTLLLTLLRLLELQSGEIILDGINIRHVSLEVLRRQCFITASQDALLLPNETLRFNLNPDLSASDDTLTTALDKLGLWTRFESALPSHIFEDDRSDSDAKDHPVLDQKLLTFPQLSGGQRQLFSLSRALVQLYTSRRYGTKPIILLDELTSALDSDTESIIHRIIDGEFTTSGHTVIMVAHRIGDLERYMKKDRDKFVFLGDGRVVEVIEKWDSETLERLRHID
ncbi:hypothetical protein K4F52_001718 [Lecanicillium sp. MT-2017a]|nr:hypothetical protein K4F52_001718 [Lecanicillium sp. MT-2017a]